MLHHPSDAAMNALPLGSALDFAAMIRELGDEKRCAFDQDGARAFALFAAMLAGEVPALELGAILMALGINGESLVQTIAFARALDAFVGHLEAPADGPLPVILPSYSGTRRHLNLTPLLALLLRRYGVPVLVHGPGGTDIDAADETIDCEIDGGADGSTFGRVTTFEIMLELGVEPARSLADAQRSLTQQRIAYVPTAVLAPSLALLLGYRARLGIRSCAHSLVKLIDPFHGDGFRVIGVAHSDQLERMREFLIATRARALLLRGTEGEPFANPRRQVQIEAFADGVGTVCAEREGCSGMPDLPAAIGAPTAAAWITQALAGSIPLPAPVIAQLACCLQGSRRAAAAA